MTTPIITELPLHLEPTTADPFLDRASSGDPAARTLTELDSRRNDGIHVRLLWNRSTDRLVVAVSEAATDDAFELAPCCRKPAACRDPPRQAARDDAVGLFAAGDWLPAEVARLDRGRVVGTGTCRL